MNHFRKSLLVVDDDLEIRAVLCEVLEQEGFEVSEATNGRGAFDILEGGASPHLILLDLMMPVMDGFEFRALQIQNPKWAEIPVIIMSADGVQQSKEKQERLHGAFFLKKPPDLDELLGMVRRHIR